MDKAPPPLGDPARLAPPRAWFPLDESAPGLDVNKGSADALAAGAPPSELTWIGFIDFEQAYFKDASGKDDRPPMMTVGAYYAKECGAFEFSCHWPNVGHPCFKMEIYSDALEGLSKIPKLWAALCAEGEAFNDPRAFAEFLLFHGAFDLTQRDRAVGRPELVRDALIWRERALLAQEAAPGATAPRRPSL